MDNVIVNKIAIIERCLQRIHEEYDNHKSELEKNFSKQDSIILNLQRASEAAIDLALHIIKIKNLEIPQSAREAFAILEKHQIIPSALCNKLQRMVGFRNIAIHDYQNINLEVINNIISTHLSDFLELNKIVLQMVDLITA